jgi:hypothetical protein
MQSPKTVGSPFLNIHWLYMGTALRKIVKTKNNNMISIDCKKIYVNTAALTTKISR